MRRSFNLSTLKPSTGQVIGLSIKISISFAVCSFTQLSRSETGGVVTGWADMGIQGSSVRTYLKTGCWPGCGSSNRWIRPRALFPGVCGMFGVDSSARNGMGDVLEVWIPGPLPRACRNLPRLLEGWRRRPSQSGLPGRIRTRLIWKGENLGVRRREE